MSEPVRKSAGAEPEFDVKLKAQITRAADGSKEDVEFSFVDVENAPVEEQQKLFALLPGFAEWYEGAKKMYYEEKARREKEQNGRNP